MHTHCQAADTSAAVLKWLLLKGSFDLMLKTKSHAKNENQSQLKREGCHWASMPAAAPFLCEIRGSSFTVRLLIFPSETTRAFDLTSVAKMHWAIF